MVYQETRIGKPVRTPGVQEILSMLVQGEPPDIIYHDKPAMVGVGLMNEDVVHSLGVKKRKKEQFIPTGNRVGVVVSEDGTCLLAQLIPETVYERMVQRWEEKPDAKWVDVKREVFIKRLLRRKNVKPIQAH